MDPPSSHIRYGGDGNPDQGLSNGEFVLERLRELQHETQPAQVDAHSGTEMTFRELLVQTVHAAEGWRSLGLGRGDVVALVARNSHEVFPVTMGAVVAGLTVACVVPHSTESELRHALSLARPRAVVSEQGRLALAMAVAPEALHVALAVAGLPDGVVSFVGLLRRGREARPPPDPDAYRAADVGPDRAQHAPFLLYSSGTTGLPKGVRLRDTTLTLAIANLRSFFASDSAERHVLLVTSALCWITGVWQLLYSLAAGLTRVFISVPDDVTIMAAIDKYKATIWVGPPTGLHSLASLHRSRYRSVYGLGSLRRVLAGGSPMGAELQASLERGLGCELVQVYGSTEAGILFGVGEDGQLPPHGSLGTLMPWVELRLVRADTGEDVPPDVHHVVAEVRVRSPYMLLDYANNPEETAAAYDELGFYKTGDLVYEDDDGNFFFVDRTKEMLKYRNQQIAPTEVEMVLLGHPGVREACVLGKPSEEMGDLPVAFVSRALNEAGAAVTEDDLEALVAERLSDHKRLRGGVVFLDQLPKNTSGKIARRLLREMLATST